MKIDKQNEIRIGACGIACEVCKLFQDKKCLGCISGSECTLKPKCPILTCAWNKKIAYCTRDCPQFPCDQFYHGACQPYSKQKLEYFKKYK